MTLSIIILIFNQISKIHFQAVGYYVRYVIPDKNMYIHPLVATGTLENNYYIKL